MTEHKHLHYLDLTQASTSREARCVQRVAALVAQIAARQASGPLARTARAVFSVLRLADSHAKTIEKLTGKLSDVQAELATVRLERRRLEATAVTEEMASSSAPARCQVIEATANTYSIRDLGAYPVVDYSEVRPLRLNTWAGHAKRSTEH